MENYKIIVGRWGENIAKEFLSRRGYKFIGANIKIGRLEIDLIFKKDKRLIFVEVKTRVASSAGPAEDALKHSQIKDLKKAIGAYCRTHRLSLSNIRLDFISIDVKKSSSTVKIKHFKDIF